MSDTPIYDATTVNTVAPASADDVTDPNAAPPENVIPVGFAPAPPDYLNTGSEAGMAPTTSQPTQVAHPTKATVRTVVAYILAALIAGAAGLPIIANMLGSYLPPKVVSVVLATGTLCGVLVATFTRLMAVPAVNDALRVFKLDAHK